MNNRRLLTLVSVFFVTCGIIIAVVSYFMTTTPVTVSYKNTSEVTVYNTSSSKDEMIGKIKRSGDSIRLKDGEYRVAYKAVEGYGNGSHTLRVGETGVKEVSIDPYFSTDRLAKQLDTEREAINKAIRDTYASSIDTYRVESDALYHFGEWYGAKLVYKGSDVFNADTLRIVLKKQANSWVVVSSPTSIVVTKLNAPSTPDDIIAIMNDF